MELESAGCSKITAPLQDKNGFLHRDRIVDGGQRNPGNGNISLLVTSALLNRKISVVGY